MTTRSYLEARFDVTALDEDERGYLAGEVQAQAERSEGHASVEVELEWNEVEVDDEPAIILEVDGDADSFPLSGDAGFDDETRKGVFDRAWAALDADPAAEVVIRLRTGRHVTQTTTTVAWPGPDEEVTP